MEKFKSYIIKIFLFIKRKFLEKREIILLGTLFIISIKTPFRFLFEQLDCMWGFNILCGVYALLFMKLINNFKGKEVFYSKSRLLIIFITAVLFSYLAVNYNIFKLILHFFFY